MIFINVEKGNNNNNKKKYGCGAFGEGDLAFSEHKVNSRTKKRSTDEDEQRTTSKRRKDVNVLGIFSHHPTRTLHLAAFTALDAVKAALAAFLAEEAAAQGGETKSWLALTIL